MATFRHKDQREYNITQKINIICFYVVYILGKEEHFWVYYIKETLKKYQTTKEKGIFVGFSIWLFLYKGNKKSVDKRK